MMSVRCLSVWGGPPLLAAPCRRAVWGSRVPMTAWKASPSASLTEVGQQLAVGWVAGASGDERVDGGTQPGSFGGGLRGGQLAGVAAVPHVQGGVQNPGHRVGGAGLTAVGGGDQVAAPPQQVRQTG